jgi:RNA polymerase sigma factor (sigma-70 family)
MRMKELEDEQILRLSIKDPSQFSIIIDRYQVAFLKAATGVVRNRQEAEDIVQETFTKIYLNAKKFKKMPDARFKSWAYRILLNTSFTHYQKAKKQGMRTEYLDVVNYDQDNPVYAERTDFASASDARAHVTEVIAKMPEHLGRLLTHYYLDDKSYQDIAKAEAIPMSTLKMRLFRAKKLFKKLSLGEES